MPASNLGSQFSTVGEKVPKNPRLLSGYMPNCQVIFGEGYGVSIFIITVFSFGLQALTDSGVPHPSVDVEPPGSRLEGVHILVVLTGAAARLHGLFHTIKHTN